MLSKPKLLQRATSVLKSAASGTQGKEEVHWFTSGESSLLPRRYRDDTKPTFLYPKDDMTMYNYAKHSDRTFKQRRQWLDYTRAKTADLPWQQRGIDWHEIEKPMIQLAFDKPEAIPLFLKDLVIKGYDNVFTQEWLKRAIHWVHEARFWRTIGVYWPFYHDYCLRVHVWRHGIIQSDAPEIRKGPMVGAPRFTQAMINAIFDLEKAYRRKELGLEPMYKWDRWSPVGFNDGRPNDWLPRLPSMKWDPDPDGVVLEYDELAFLTEAPENKENPLAVLDEMKSRYHEFIYSDSEVYNNCFKSTTSSGDLQPKDFVERFPDVQLPLENLRDMAYLVAYQETKKQGAGAETIDIQDFQANVLPQLREANDAKVEAIRLFHNCSSEIAWVRRYIQEKTGIEDFMKTPDKELTRITEVLLGEMLRVVDEYPWGKELAQCTTMYEYKMVAGDIAHSVAKQIEDASLNRRREKWNSRFSGEGKEEQQLDFMLQNMAQRTNVTQDSNNFGQEFDREKEPIGRDTQRRVLYSDKQTTGRRKWQRKKERFEVDRSLLLTKLE